MVRTICTLSPAVAIIVSAGWGVLDGVIYSCACWSKRASVTYFNVWSERKRIEKLRYMHRNPVQRGLVGGPEQWAWSSFRSYACGEEGAVRVNEWGTARLRIKGKAA